MNDREELSCFKSSRQLIAGVLVAISIPIFTSQLEKARDAVSIANIRAAYAEAASSYLAGSSDVGTDAKVTVDMSKKTVTVKDVALKGTQTGFSGLQAELPFTHTLSDSSAEGGKKGNYTLLFTYDDKGACTLTSLTQQN